MVFRHQQNETRKKKKKRTRANLFVGLDHFEPAVLAHDVEHDVADFALDDRDLVFDFGVERIQHTNLAAQSKRQRGEYDERRRFWCSQTALTWNSEGRRFRRFVALPFAIGEPGSDAESLSANDGAVRGERPSESCCCLS